MAVRVADTIKQLNDNTDFPVVEANNVSITIDGNTTNVQQASDDGLLGGGGEEIVKVTKAEYENLTDIQTDTLYIVTDEDSAAITVDEYNDLADKAHTHENKDVLDKLTEGTDENSNSILLYNGEQIASGNIKTLTKAEYDALEAKDEDTIYVVTDDDTDIIELIDDTTSSTVKTYSSSKIDEKLANISSIDDENSSTTTTYSSSKIDDKISNINQIDDTTASTTTTYSSSKIDEKISAIEATTLSETEYNALSSTKQNSGLYYVYSE